MKTKHIIVLLFILCTQWLLGATVDTIKIESHLMSDKILKAVVILPDNYSADTKKRYPTVYLLHGYSGSYDNWIMRVPAIQALADRHQVIIVCPDGGYSSWYFDSPIDSNMRYESYMVKELVPTIDKLYKTIPTNTQRAITGLSMGGHGAMYLAIKHPDIWWSMGSLSGGVDIRPCAEKWDIKKRLGSYTENQDIWDRSTVINMAGRLDKTINRPIILSCGVDDFFFPVNQELHHKLVEAQVMHTYITSQGGHSWEYWNRSVPYHFLFFSQFFKAQKEDSP